VRPTPASLVTHVHCESFTLGPKGFTAVLILHGEEGRVVGRSVAEGFAGEALLTMCADLRDMVEKEFVKTLAPTEEAGDSAETPFAFGGSGTNEDDV
jgi:hypothetical protein